MIATERGKPCGIGIMQGRLSPPSNGRIQSFPKTTWRDEFGQAVKAGVTGIEWIFERDEWERNPIASDRGIEEIREAIRQTGVTVPSVCADYFMDIPYLKADEATRRELRDKLVWLVIQASRIGARYIDLPFVDASKIGGREEFPAVKEFIAPGLEAAHAAGITIALETSLDPVNFTALLSDFNHPNLMANYDTGNSSGIGYDCAEELVAYGKWIRTVHIKDRVLGGGTVPLGTGNAKFGIFFEELRRLDFSGPIILQAAREGDEVETAMKNIRFVQGYLQRA